MSNKIIELQNVKRQFEDGVVVVDDLNLYVRKGEFITFLGPSGCGKTTTLRMIAGFDKPTEGKILLNGKDISNLPPNKRPINTVFQRYALFPHLNVYDNVAFGLKMKKVKVTYKKETGEAVEKIEKYKKWEIAKKVEKVLKMVDLEGFEKRSVSTLSGGQQQRVAIARALAKRPKLLLCDEPTGALDYQTGKNILKLLQETCRKENMTVVLVTHNQAITPMADRVIRVKNSKVESMVINKKLTSIDDIEW